MDGILGRESRARWSPWRVAPRRATPSPMREIDPIAQRWFERSWVPSCLRIPISARSVEAITRYVGTVERELSRPGTGRAFLVRAPTPPAHLATTCTLDLPIWEHWRAEVLRQSTQVWVDVDYTAYRRAYQRAFPELDLSGQFIDHVENRRRGRAIGLRFVRLCHVSRAVNTSSGTGVERIGVDKTGAPTIGGPWGEVRYAGVDEWAKMIGIEMGGGVLNGLRDALDLFEPRAGWKARAPCDCDRVALG